MSAHETTQSFEGYSDYQTVSNSIARSIDNAIEAYTLIESLHVEDARVRAAQAAQARSKIKLAALKIVPELRDDAPSNPDYQAILARWHGGYQLEDSDERIQPDYHGDDVEGGYLHALNNHRLVDSSPDWLEQFVVDIRTAGWELGYLKAGRTNTESNLDPVEEDARAMFETN